MSHYVYIVFSVSYDLYYKGESSNPYERLQKHNSDESTFTANKGPWELVYIEELTDRSAALKREKQIKRLNRRSIEKLIQSELNILRLNSFGSSG